MNEPRIPSLVRYRGAYDLRDYMRAFHVHILAVCVCVDSSSKPRSSVPGLFP